MSHPGKPTDADLDGLADEREDASDWETPCPKRDDRIHCHCWWEGERCCSCGAPAMTEQEKRDQGMETVPVGVLIGDRVRFRGEEYFVQRVSKIEGDAWYYDIERPGEVLLDIPRCQFEALGPGEVKT